MILISTLQLYAEKQIELTPIVLPYDSLNIDEVYGYGATIIARSGNTIYHSTDDGGSWDIALESATKLNQLYSKDPHTVFAIGDSGLVYRTFDYGASWVDVSIDTDLELRAMAAGDYSEYMIITPRTYSFRKNGQDNEAFALSNWSSIHLQSIVKHKDGYKFSGGYYTDIYRAFGNDYRELFIPLYSYDDKNEVQTTIADEHYGVESTYSYTIDSLNLHVLGDDIFYSTKFGYKVYEKNVAGLTNNPGIIHNVFVDSWFGARINNDKFIHIDRKDSVYSYITREGIFNRFYESEFYTGGLIKPFFLHKFDFAPINHVNNFDYDCYYFATNNSTIYKSKLIEVQSSVEQKSDNNIFQYGDIIELKNGSKLIYISNYMGQKLSMEELGYGVYKLAKGLSFITYQDKENNIRTVKVMVIE
jgi:hypothetical protein